MDQWKKIGKNLKWPKNRIVYREVPLEPNDFRRLIQLYIRLERFYYCGSITRTSSMIELEKIINKLEKLLKEYDKRFENHSVILSKKKKQKQA